MIYFVAAVIALLLLGDWKAWDMVQNKKYGDYMFFIGERSLIFITIYFFTLCLK